MQAGAILVKIARGFRSMAGKGKRLVRATVSLDQLDYGALAKLAEEMEVSTSWLIRQAIRNFLDRYGEHGQPELALNLAGKNKRQ